MFRGFQLAFWSGLLCVLMGCGGQESKPIPSSLQDISITGWGPSLWLPGTLVELRGAGFVPDFAGPSELLLNGRFNGSPVNVRIDARFVDYDQLACDWPGSLLAGLPQEAGVFEGSLRIEALSKLDGLLHFSNEVPLSIEFRSQAQPELEFVQNSVLFVNDPVVVRGKNFLLGTSEGKTVAVVSGCYRKEGASECKPVAPSEVLSQPLVALRRDRITFPFAPAIAGIEPGRFEGTLRLSNRHGVEAGQIVLDTGDAELINDIVAPVILEFQSQVASLGQIVGVSGGGFVGIANQNSSKEFTTLVLEGDFQPKQGAAMPVALELLPKFVTGQLVRYVVNEEDQLGQSIDVRNAEGSFAGTAQPVTRYGDQVVYGDKQAVSLSLAAVKQVVWLRFLPVYVESLRRFGLRAVDAMVRERIFSVVRRDFGGVNFELRSEKPEDFELFSEVEVGGPDPNGVGLLGYDNTPGKDTGNLRLYDKIGGVNALTQGDGYPGYGGVFVESLFVFSEHPGAWVQQTGQGDPLFDLLFDPFRPDQGGVAVGASELVGVEALQSSESCPAQDRRTQALCAVWALGTLVGTTISHEVAHALGLADPGGSAFHNGDDFALAIMDSGSLRPFSERVEIGTEASRFCQHNYAYLKQILPSSATDPWAFRPSCY